MKWVKYEVRNHHGIRIFGTDNLFTAYEMKDDYDRMDMPVTLHEIITTERDITNNARITPDDLKQQQINDIIDEVNNL
jgi:hypothetical protein